MLIDRDKAILKCQERLYESALNNVEVECKADEVYSDIAQNRIKDWLEELPSAERVGKWIIDLYKFGRERYKCSRCNLGADVDYYYCPNCGARMVSE